MVVMDDMNNSSCRGPSHTLVKDDAPRKSNCDLRALMVECV